MSGSIRRQFGLSLTRRLSGEKIQPGIASDVAAASSRERDETVSFRCPKTGLSHAGANKKLVFAVALSAANRFVGSVCHLIVLRRLLGC